MPNMKFLKPRMLVLICDLSSYCTELAVFNTGWVLRSPGNFYPWQFDGRASAQCPCLCHRVHLGGHSYKMQIPTERLANKRQTLILHDLLGDRNSLLGTFLWGCFISVAGAEFVGRTMIMAERHRSSCVRMSGCGWTTV